MAETAILAALQLLSQAVVAIDLGKQTTQKSSEISSTFSDLDTRMKNISSELRVVQAFLNQMNRHDESNAPLVAWTGEVQKVANQVEDIAKEYISIVKNQKLGGKRFYLKMMFKEPKSLLALKRISSQLEKAEKSLEHLGKMKDRWVTINNTNGGLGSGSNTNDANDFSAQVAIASHFINEYEIIGIDDNREKLTRLMNSEEPRLSVISVWGMAGVGKTTLVTNVFNREKKHFNSHAWICISQNYKVDHVLRSLISEICKNGQNGRIDIDTMDTRQLKETVLGLLHKRKYLIVLDDAWDQNSFDDIRDVFHDFHQGSRVIITTRNAGVACLAGQSSMLELKPLPFNESWNLFSRRAFQFERNHECPPHLKDWAKKIVLKCDGLPLALVSLGSILSCYGKVESKWKFVHDQLSWELQHNKSFDRLKSVLHLSFNQLPIYLRNCFLYCCMFPEDYTLARKKRIRLWIAEGFVEQRGGNTLEETAESYLLELINLSMLQVVEENFSGRVKNCRIHDTFRELAISLCIKDNFGMLYGNSGELMNIDTSVRRLFIIKFGENIAHDVRLPQLRTLMSFDHSMLSAPLLTLDLLKFRCLTVLSLENSSIESLPDKIGDLFNLQYLGLRNSNVKVLPDSIKELHNLQTLDLKNSEIQKLPDGVAELKMLRHLFAEIVKDHTYVSFQSFSGICLPKGVCYLKDLQTLHSVDSNSMVVRELGNLTQLRSIRIWNVKENDSAELCRSLSKMRFLSSLSVNAAHENEVLHLEGLNLPQLHKLLLRGRLRGRMLQSPNFQLLGENIQTLLLRWSQLENDPLPYLSHLRNLTYLSLRRAYEGNQLVFEAGWFPKLKYLALRQMPNVSQVEMKKGTMVSLEQLYFWDLKQLMEIPKGIKHLSSLKEMFSIDMPADFHGLAKGTHKLFHFMCQVV